MEKIQKYLPLATFILILFIFLKGCGTSTQVKSTEKKVEQLNHKVDSLSITFAFFCNINQYSGASCERLLFTIKWLS